MNRKKSAAEARAWASETFGHAKLGDGRRRARLIAMGARAAQRPNGAVTRVFPGSAEREGAFRFLENSAISAESVMEAPMSATARRCSETTDVVYVAVDGSSLTFTDRAKRRQLGRVGNSRACARGLQVMSALAVDADGAPIGLLDQQWWAREQPVKKRKGNDNKCHQGNYMQRETRFWLHALDGAEGRMAEHAPSVRRWYQLDRGADCWPVFQRAQERNLLITVRAVHNRRVLRPNGRASLLKQELRRQPVLGTYQLNVPERPNRRARCAQMTVRACTVIIEARVTSKRRLRFQLNAVLAEEKAPRAGRLRWMLLTTHPVKTMKQARAVIHGYSMRWRIEEFHRTWKRGLCNAENSQLHSQLALRKWLTILAAVAARALRLAYLVRNSPDVPAFTEFTTYEIDAAFLLGADPTFTANIQWE